MSDVLGVILAGGQARRMGGGDKCLLELSGRTLLEHVIDRLGPQVDAMALNANGDPARFERFSLPVIADSAPDFPGPLAGVLAGLDWAAKQAAAQIVTVAADTPFFPENLVETLIAHRHAIVLAATQDTTQVILRHPTFGLWPVALREDLRAALGAGTRKVVAWTDQHGGREALFGPSGPLDEPFFNLNTPQDMQRARQALEGAA